MNTNTAERMMMV